MENKKVSEETAAAVRKTENRFSKEQLLAAECFRERKDLVEALLDENGRYTVKMVEQMIEKYRKGRVE